MGKIKLFFTNFRVIILIIFLLLAVVAIRPALSSDGVAIRSVQKGYSAELAGMTNPDPGSTPRSREVILSINNQKIKDIIDYDKIVSSFIANETVVVETNKGSYSLKVESEYIGNGTDKKNLGVKDIGLKVYNTPTTNIRKGLDLQGGTRVLLVPERKLTIDEMTLVIDNMKQRLNVYGLSDIIIRPANDLPPPLGNGNQYIIVEIAGVSEQEVRTLLENQGKFEAKIGNDVAFTGGKDITYVCRSADCSGIDPNYGCQTVDQQGNFMCRFRFTITLSQQAAQSQASLTDKLSVVTVDKDGKPLPENSQYLNESIDLYLDNEKVDSLNIGKDLKGNAATNIQISGSGTGVGQQNAMVDSLQSMKNLQTVLVTGSLPVKLEIVKVDTISSHLGERFTNNAILVGLLAMLAVIIVIFLRYHSIRVALPISITMISEVVLLLGIASLIGWNLDLAAIAAIIVAVGTGVDDQIIITDEILSRDKKEVLTWKQKIGRAFFIIMAAYFVTVVAMIPLWFAGAGLLKGFAIITILGVSIGVFITRPAYAAMLEIFEKE